MSTRSAIITKTENGYEGIYCHSDGYLSGVGKTLLDHYQDEDKVSDLIEIGDISFLERNVNPNDEHSFDRPECGVTVAYGRDRGESDTESKVGDTIEEVADQIGHNGYVYVFEDGQWTCNGKEFDGTDEYN